MKIESHDYTLDLTEDYECSHNVSIQIGILIKAYGQIGMLDKAFEIFRDHQAKASKTKVNNDITFGCLIDACVRNSQIHKAESIFHEIVTQGSIAPNTVIYTTMIKAYSRTFNIQKALEIYYIMISPEGQEKIEPNIITFNSIIDCCVRCGEIDQATQIFEYMRNKSTANPFDSYYGVSRGIKPDLITFSTLIKGHCRCKNIE